MDSCSRYSFCVRLPYSNMRITFLKVFHVLYVSVTFLFVTEWYSIVSVHHTLFIHSPIDGHVIQIVAIINKASFFVDIHFHFSW